ncbi:tetratricopeptide repeat protein [Treponema sp.]|uniref:tetratricopeptide repeat protein n=1 Tax=Treponema sp. TaxID=166 RepID=UPI003F0DAD2B
MKKNLLRGIAFAFLILRFSCPVSAQKSSALEFFNRAQKLQLESRWFDAVDLYQEALSLNPQYGDALYNLALCHYALGSYDLCVQYADEASRYARNFSDIQNLKGMALISLGRVDEAKSVFTGVLKDFPNDVNARFGLAELDLLDGRLTVAESRYQDALKRDASNRKALLSLALVSAEMGKTEISENYIRQALSYYSGEPEVHYMAAYLAAKNMDYIAAEQRARSAVLINGNFDKAYSLLAGILYAQKRFNEVIDICDFRIGRNRNAVDAWYLKGRSLQQQGKTEDAISAYETGLSIAPQDEVMRNALEQLVCGALMIEDERRNVWADFHSDKAAEYGRNFEGIAERYEYQKALSISPLNNKIRQSFADMLERDGHYELYLQQLKFIRENESAEKKQAPVKSDENSLSVKRTRAQIKNDDAIEVYESLLRNNISSRWNVDPFYLDKTRWNIGIYYIKKPIQLLHADLEEISAVAAKEVFNGVPSAYVEIQLEPVDGYGQAFRLARSSGCDYFVILEASETERTYSLDAVLYSARTGTKTSEIHVYRTGNDCMARAMQRLRQGILSVLPIRGKVLRNVHGQLLVDLGKNDGISKGSEFHVVRRGTVMTKDSGPGVSYSDKNFLGTFVVELADEELSEGVYKKNGFYDTLNVGDEVVLVKNPEKDGESLDNRPAADESGEPATEDARKAELESLKESLRPASRENELIHLIRTII